jgi:hypothetical protein
MGGSCDRLICSSAILGQIPLEFIIYLVSMSVPSTTAAYPHDPLTVIAGRPTYKTLQVLKHQLFANAGTIESMQGGGAHGHLALLLDPAIYLTLSNNGIAFVASMHPGPMPIHPAAQLPP